tara:strand:- start:9710 stop:11452 length:1743 start_codon:yes stop_codon:yes gene_type:complete
LIEIINKKIELFISSIESIDKDSVRIILNKSSTSISDDLDKGHITSNVCMVAASILKLNPRELSEKLKNTLDELNIFKNIQIAGPGFINITLHKKEFASVLHNIIEERDSFGESNIGDGKKVQIEFVSANPTGPLHVGHGRGAAYGDAIGRILKATGSTVEKEYYINDAGRQIDILTASVILRAVQKKLSNFFPQNAYKGNYIDSISEEFTSNNKIEYDNVESIIKDLSSDPEEEIDNIIIKLKNLDDLIWNSVKSFSLDSIIDSIKNDLEDFNVSFDSWFNESSLGTLNDDSSEISESITKLKKDGKAYEKDGAIWLNTENSGDDKHRVLIRDDGRTTYFASDVAYHKNKIDRGYDDLINVWGADHHGYIKRIQASIDALGSKKEKLTVKLVQFANLFKNGESIKMSTRSGEFFTLRELLEDIGADAARFYYLSKQADQHLDFDINLAKSDSKENIFYYIQYAHARIFSLEQKYVEMYPGLGTSIEAIEKDLYDKCDPLIHEISKYPKIVNKSARMLQPHIIIFYLKDLSQLFHSYYNDNHVLSESKENMQSIILCLSAVRQIISNGLSILGISPMQKM